MLVSVLVAAVVVVVGDGVVVFSGITEANCYTKEQIAYSKTAAILNRLILVVNV